MYGKDEYRKSVLTILETRSFIFFMTNDNTIANQYCNYRLSSVSYPHICDPRENILLLVYQKKSFWLLTVNFIKLW